MIKRDILAGDQRQRPARRRHRHATRRRSRSARWPKPSPRRAASLVCHFSNPAPFIPGVELIPHAGTEPRSLAVGGQIIEAGGKQCAQVRDVTGFVLNRPPVRACSRRPPSCSTRVWRRPEDIDTIVRTTFGFRLPFFGPFPLPTWPGSTSTRFATSPLQAGLPRTVRPPHVLGELVEAGRLGSKSGAGFFDVPAERVRELVAYRNKAYVAMQRLLDELGPAPI